MRSYLLLFSLSLLFSLGLTPVVRRWALRWGAVDLPDGKRRIHQHPTPRLGGVAIYLAFVGTLLCAFWLNNPIGKSLLANWQTVAVILIAGTLIFALGVYDDFHNANAAVKITVQVLAAAILYGCGFRISALSSPFGGSWELPVILSFPLTALWIVGITNAFNLIDGIDGLAAGASSFALLSLFVCSLVRGYDEVSLLSLLLVGAVIGFLRYNFNPASIFLGDSGSLLLGFMAAALSLIGTQKSPTLIAIAIPLVSFGLPVTEVLVSMGRRMLSGAPLFEGDRRHIHHMLLHRGLTQRQAAILLYAVCALFSLLGMLLLSPQQYAPALIFFVLGGGILIGVQQLRYPEFDGLGQQLKQEVEHRRKVIACNLLLQDIRDELALAHTFEQVLASLARLSLVQGINLITLTVHQVPANLESTSQTVQALAHNATPEGSAWRWNWNRGKSVKSTISLISSCWILKRPLADGQNRPLGTVTFHCELANKEILFGLDQVCDSLCRELNAALVRLNKTPQPYLDRNLQEAELAA